MADEEEYGRAVIRIDLDDTEAEIAARTLGPRLEQILKRATRRLGRTIRNNIQNGLRGAALKVDVVPDLSRFLSSLRTAAAGQELTVPVAPDLTGFEDRVRAAVGGALEVPVLPDLADFAARVRTALAGQELTVPVAPDLSGFDTAVRAASGGSLDVPVLPDLSDFAARVRTALAGEGLTVPVGPDLADFADRVRTALAGLRLTVPVGPDLADFTDRVRAALAGEGLTVSVAPDLDRLSAAVRGHDLPELPLTLVPDLERLDRAVRGHKLPDLPLTLVADLDGITRQVRGTKLPQLAVDIIPDLTGFMARVRAFLADEEVSLRVVPDMSGFNAAVRAHPRPDVTANVNVDRNRLTRALAGVTRIAAGVGKALAGLLAFGAVGIAAAGAAVGVGAFLAALAPAAGIVAAFPAAILTSVAALAALKLALSGVGDAFSAALTADAEKFEESLEGLSPKAQAAAREVRALKPAFEELRETVQDAFFAKFEGQITKVASVLGGTLQRGLKNIAGGFGAAAKEGLKFLQTQRALTDIDAILTGTSDAVGGLSGAIQPVLQGLLDIGAAVSKAFGKQLGDGIASAGQRLGDFLTRAADSGRAVTAVREAVAVFRQLGTLLGNLGGIIRGALQAGEEAGAGFLQNLVTITGQVEAFVKSAEGQTALQNTFATIGTIAAQLGPILSALITQVGAIAPSLEPIFTALGPALVNLINGLGPALAAIAPSLATIGTALADALSTLSSGGALTAVGQVVGGLVSGLAPLLPLVASLANTVLGALAPAFQAALAVLNPVITAVTGALMPILPPLAAALQQILTAVIPLGVALGQFLAQAVVALGPLLSVLATAIAQVVTAFLPFVQQVTAALLPVLPPLLAAFQAIVNAVIPLVGPIAGLAAALGPLAAKIIELVAPLLQFAAVAVQAVAIEILVPIISGIVSALSGLASVLTSVVGFLTAFVDAAIAGFQYLYDVLVGNSIIPDLIAAIIRFFTSLPGRILGVLSGLVSAVAGVFTSMASTALASVRTFVSDAVSYLRGLPAKARAALSAAKSALVSAGADLIRGLINGIKSMAGSLVSAAKGVVSGAVDGAKNLLGISSPSKVFAEIGRDTGKGFIVGLTGTASQIQQTVERMTRSITNAFKDQTSTVDDRLVDLLAAGNKRLQALAKQREGIVERLATAQKFAADTTKAALSTGSLQTLTQGTDEQNTDTVIDGLRRATRGVKDFTDRIAQLSKRGLNKGLLQQIIDLGPQQGAALAQSIAEAEPATLKRINQLQNSFRKASEQLGKTGADALYDAGQNAGAGFLAGLKGQRKAIEQLMLDIAKSMQKSIRAALRIQSPSRVFMDIGNLTGEGLELGFLDRIAALQKTAVTAADDVAEGVASSFALLPALITQSLGSVNTDVLKQLRSSLPSTVRGFLPFANGGEINRPTIGLLGEAGREVVIPMTRPARARQLADSSGLTDLLLDGRRGRGGGKGAAGGATQNNYFTINEVGDGTMTAHRVANRLAYASGL